MEKWIYEVIASSVDMTRSCACRLLRTSPIYEKQGKGGFRNVSRKLRRSNFSCAGLQAAAGRIMKFSHLKHATSPNTWAEK